MGAYVVGNMTLPCGKVMFSDPPVQRNIDRHRRARATVVQFGRVAVQGLGNDEAAGDAPENRYIADRLRFAVKKNVVCPLFFPTRV